MFHVTLRHRLLVVGYAHQEALRHHREHDIRSLALQHVGRQRGPLHEHQPAKRLGQEAQQRVRVRVAQQHARRRRRRLAMGDDHGSGAVDAVVVRGVRRVPGDACHVRDFAARWVELAPEIARDRALREEDVIAARARASGLRPQAVRSTSGTRGMHRGRSSACRRTVPSPSRPELWRVRSVHRGLAASRQEGLRAPSGSAAYIVRFRVPPPLQFKAGHRNRKRPSPLMVMRGTFETGAVTKWRLFVWRQLDFPVDDHYFSRTHQPVVIRSRLEPGGPSWPAPRGSSARSTPRSRSDGPAGRSPPPSSSRP